MTGRIRKKIPFDIFKGGLLFQLLESCAMNLLIKLAFRGVPLPLMNNGIIRWSLPLTLPALLSFPIPFLILTEYSKLFVLNVLS